MHSNIYFCKAQIMKDNAEFINKWLLIRMKAV